VWDEKWVVTYDTVFNVRTPGVCTTVAYPREKFAPHHWFALGVFAKPVRIFLTVFIILCSRFRVFVVSHLLPVTVYTKRTDTISRRGTKIAKHFPPRIQAAPSHGPPAHHPCPDHSSMPVPALFGGPKTDFLGGRGLPVNR